MSASHAPWQPREQASVLGVAALAQRIGRAVFVEERLFEILGGWITDTPDPLVKERLAAHCHRHAAHVAMWRERLPQATGVDGASMVTSPGAGVDEALTLVSEPSDTLLRLVGVHRVLVPRLIAAHTFHRHITNAVTDAPTASVLDTVVADLVQEWRDGELVVETLLAAADPSATDVAALASHQAAVERALVSAGGILGPGTLG